MVCEVANPRQSTCITNVHVDKHVDKSNTARFYLFRFYGINRKITILQVFVLLFNR